MLSAINYCKNGASHVWEWDNLTQCEIKRIAHLLLVGTGVYMRHNSGVMSSITPIIEIKTKIQ